MEAVQALACKAGLNLITDHAMHSNNRCLVWHLPAVDAGDSISLDARA